MKDWNEMTEEEADKLDEYYTTHTVKAGPNLLMQGKKPGFTHDPGRVVTIDTVAAVYLQTCAQEEHTTPAQIINKMVREKIAALV
jgi:hypothetical protein